MRESMEKAKTFYPKNIAELLNASAKALNQYVVIGNGLSHQSLNCVKNKNKINLSKMNKIVKIDGNNVTVEAGATLHKIVRQLNLHGLTLPVLPDYLHISIGACIATPVHGSHTEASSIASYVTAFTYLKNAKIEHIKKDEAGWNELFFNLDHIIIVEVTLTAAKSFYLERSITLHQEAILNDLNVIFKSHFCATFQWYLREEKVLILTFKPSKLAKKQGFSFYLPRCMISSKLAKLNTWFPYSNKNYIVSELLKMPFFHPVIIKFAKFFNKGRTIEMSIQVEKAQELITHIKNDFKANPSVPLSVGIRFGSKDPYLHSPCFKRDCLWICIRTSDQYWVERFQKYANKYLGQFHKGKFVPDAKN